jgi:hypothetical protein
MKNIGILIVFLAAALLVVINLIVFREMGIPARKPPQEASPLSLAEELQKTEASLRRLEAMDIPSATLSPEDMSAAAKLFPTAPPVQPTAWAESGYSASLAATTLAVTREPPDANTAVAAPAEAQELSNVSFIYFSPDFRRAVVDDRLVREGEQLPDGARVAKIERDSVLFRKKRQRYRIKVPGIFTASLYESTR